MNLAIKYRPKRLDDIVGQRDLLAPNAPLRLLIESNSLPHTLFYGPTGCGKTTLSRIIASTMQKPFYEMNATTLKVEDLRKIFREYTNTLEKPLIFIDEIHRLSKNQQEVLLPFMEDNSALIIGASTQNPYHSMTSAMRSRSHTFELHHIEDDEMRRYLNMVIDSESFDIDRDAKEFLISSSGGDARAMLNLLESGTAIESPLRVETLKAIRSRAIQAGSSEDDSHYELTSAMIKSIRGSDIDAALYYLARLVEGGEPAEFIARRLAILASEDIGNANPNALNLASSTLNIVKHIGYPEARISLAQLLIYLASSPKSNSSYMAINRAQEAIKDGIVYPIPDHIKSHNREYLNPHDYGGWVEQSYSHREFKFYKSIGIGFEKSLNEWISKIKRL